LLGRATRRRRGLRPRTASGRSGRSLCVSRAGRTLHGPLQLASDALQFTHGRAQPKYHEPSDNPNRSAQDQGVAGAKLVVGNAETNRSEAQSENDEADRHQKGSHRGNFS
jgi:hypothetical protein